MYSVPPQKPERRWKGPEHGCASIVLTLLSLAGLAGLIPYWMLAALGFSDSGTHAQWQAWSSFWDSPFRLIDAVLLGAFVFWLLYCAVRGWRLREIALNLGGVVGCYIYVTLAPFLW
jgi:hypothetical protein